MFIIIYYYYYYYFILLILLFFLFFSGFLHGFSCTMVGGLAVLMRRVREGFGMASGAGTLAERGGARGDWDRVLEVLYIGAISLHKRRVLGLHAPVSGSLMLAPALKRPAF